MTAFTSWILGHRKLVVAFWVVLTLVGMATAGAATEAMDQKFSNPGKEGWETSQQIMREYRGTGGDSAPLVPVVQVPAGKKASDPDVKADLERVEQTIAKTLPGARIAGYASTNDDAFVSKDGRTTFILAYPRPDPDSIFGENTEAEKDLRAALKGATVAGAPVRLSGFDALANAAGDAEGPGVLVEAMVGGLGALVVLAFVFGSLMAFIPLLMAIPSILVSFLAVYGLTAITDVSPIVQFLIALIGLGVSIDYALLLVVRWREERAHGHDGDEAILYAMRTAGRSIVFSGTTVAIGLLALVVLPVPFMRSVGIGGLIIPVMSVAVSLSLLPVILHTLGGRLDWPHKRTDDKASRNWTRWAEIVVKRRWASAGIALVLLGVLTLAAAQLRLGISDVDTIAKSGDAKVGLQQLESSGIGKGAILPHEILTTPERAGAVQQAAAGVEGMHGAAAPASWQNGKSAIVEVLPTRDGSSTAARDAVDPLRDAARGADPEAKLGGQVAANNDFIDSVYGAFPLMIALITLITFILLARAFRSLLLPAKAVILNVISVGAAWGVMQLVWQSGHGSDEIFGIASTGAIASWIPLMVFAFLYGLSMDYEVFILARMREEYDATGSTSEAVIRGIGRTGRLVTSAALILFLAFIAMASGPQTDVKILATGLAAGILIDATIIRALLVPAVVSLFGRWNWVLPAGPAKLLRVEPSLPPRTAAAEA
ncbi:MAG TPA: MMPL family transporter [Solirubrobacteraceae bacterium]